jgi:hypothetical protein
VHRRGNERGCGGESRGSNLAPTPGSCRPPRLTFTQLILCLYSSVQLSHGLPYSRFRSPQDDGKANFPSERIAETKALRQELCTLALSMRIACARPDSSNLLRVSWVVKFCGETYPGTLCVTILGLRSTTDMCSFQPGPCSSRPNPPPTMTP